MYKVDLKWLTYNDEPNIAREWCCEQFGSQKNADNRYVWRTRNVWGLNEHASYSYYTCFYFEREEHRNWFLLRFS